MVSFTGSSAVGRRIGELAGKHLKKVQLELGGKNAVIVLDDADLDGVASAVAFGAWFHQGQICMTTGLVIAHEKIADALIEKLVAKAKHLPVGDPTTGQVALGPVISRSQVDRIHGIVKDTVAAGAKLSAGGTFDGPFYRPTVLAGVKPGMRAFDEEVFGPVAAIATFATEDEAVELANGNEYGCRPACSRSRSAARSRSATACAPGLLHINDQTVADEPHVPVRRHRRIRQRHAHRWSGQLGGVHPLAVGDDQGQAEPLSVLMVRMAAQHLDAITREKAKRCQFGQLRRDCGHRSTVSAGSAPAADPPKSVRIGYAVSLSGVNAQGAAVTTLSALQAVGRRRQQEGRPPGQGIRQTDSDRGHRIRRHQQRRDRGAAGRAADDPGQGRFRAAALEHRLQPGDRAGVRAQRLSAACGDGQLQRRANSRQADADAVLLPQRAAPFRRRARRGPEQAQEREQDQQQDRDAQRRRPVRRRVHVGVLPVLQKAGFEFVLRKSYPLGSADLTNEIKEAKASGADSFIAYSYPPDTFMLTNTAVTQGYNPKVFRWAWAPPSPTSAPVSRKRRKGVLGLGGWDPHPGAQDYLKR